ncbi:hypothetical protein [Nocardia anaemiae]|uniref:hypothetical protein n=1 Tax=Nocardia anaemiae TaxID=263910 RepID=UPI0007A3E478|nr:hypothetical protein [Nocardia anaemiae]
MSPDPDPDPAAHNHDHANHLAELAAGENLTRRQVLLVWREPLDNPVVATARALDCAGYSEVVGLGGGCRPPSVVVPSRGCYAA